MVGSAPIVSLRTHNLDQAIDAVTRVYCPHTITVNGAARNIDAALEVPRPGVQPLVFLRYSTAVTIDAGDFPRLFLMMNCSSGSAAVRQNGDLAEWRQGQTMPMSAGRDTRLWFDQSFAQTGVRLDIDRLESLCARWLGRPLDEPLRFALRPFSAPLDHTWQRTLDFLWSTSEGPMRTNAMASASIEEFILTLLLQEHPHNYSDEFAEPAPAAVPRLVRRAERYMAENAHAPITASDVAATLGVSLRSLQAGFRESRRTTPTTHLRELRLARVHDELRRSQPEATVTEVALRWGFSHLGRFSAHYSAAFGESPVETLRRARRAGGASRRSERDV